MVDDSKLEPKIPKQSIAMNYIKWDNYSTSPLNEWFKDKLTDKHYTLKQEGVNQLLKSLLIILKPDLIYANDFEQEIELFKISLENKLGKLDDNLDRNLVFRQKFCNLYDVNLIVFIENKFKIISHIVPTYADPRDPKRLTFMIINQDKTSYYSPILCENITTDTSVIKYEDYGELLQKIYDDNFPSIDIDIPANLEKQTITQLQELCAKLGYNTTKTSEKTGKIVKKQKKELIELISLHIKKSP